MGEEDSPMAIAATANVENARRLGKIFAAEISVMEVHGQVCFVVTIDKNGVITTRMRRK